MKTIKVICQVTMGLLLASVGTATAHASTIFQTAASQLGAAYDNTNLMPIGVPAISVTNAPQTFTNLNPTVDYSYSTDGSTNASAGFIPDGHFIGSAGIMQPAGGPTGPIWTFSAQVKDYYLYETTDHGLLPGEGLETTLWGSSDGGVTWNLGTVVKVYEQGWNSSWTPDDGSTRWSFNSPVSMVAAVAALNQGTYVDSGAGDFEIDAVMQVPEPSSAALFLAGAVLMLLWRKRRG